MTEIDRDPLIDELRAALDAASSAGFAKRVRRSVDVRTSRRVSWWLAAAAATTVGGVMLSMGLHTANLGDQPVKTSASLTKAIESRSRSDGGVMLPRENGGTTPSSVRRATRVDVSHVDVLVPVEERQAIATFVYQVQTGGIDPPAGSSAEVIEPEALQLQPIDLDKTDGGRRSSASQGRVR